MLAGMYGFVELCLLNEAETLPENHPMEIVDTLNQCNIKSAQITLDGIGEAHDATRHLTGGGSTFECITENLRTLKIPFKVSVRHNVHKGNTDQVPELRALIEKNCAGKRKPVKILSVPCEL